MSIESLLDRTAGNAVRGMLEPGAKVAAEGVRDVTQGAKTAVAKADSLTLSTLAHDHVVRPAGLPALPWQQSLGAWKDGFLTRSGLGRIVWGGATTEKSVLGRARASVMRSAVAIDQSSTNLSDLSSREIDDLLSTIAARATSEVKGAQNVKLTVAAIGNYGRREIGPFSGLNFAVLTEGDPAAQKVAGKVAKRMVSHLKALGETTILKPGLRPGAYMSPGGLYGQALIGTPTQMARSALLDATLPTEVRWSLQDLRPVFSNSTSDLAKTYNAALSKAMNTPMPLANGASWGRAEARAMATKAALAHIPEGADGLGLFNPAESVEGPISLALRALALNAGARGTTTAERVDALVAKGALPQDLGSAVKAAATWAGNVRVKGQIAQGWQNDIVKLDSTESAAARQHLATVRQLVSTVAGR